MRAQTDRMFAYLLPYSISLFVCLFVGLFICLFVTSASVRLVYKKVTLNAGLHVRMLTILQNSPARYPICRVQMSSFEKPAGISIIQETLVSQNEIPQIVFLMIVT